MSKPLRFETACQVFDHGWHIGHRLHMLGSEKAVQHSFESTRAAMGSNYGHARCVLRVFLNGWNEGFLDRWRLYKLDAPHLSLVIEHHKEVMLILLSKRVRRMLIKSPDFCMPCEKGPRYMKELTA